MLPPGENFKADDRAGTQVDLRLEERQELIMLETQADRMFQLASGDEGLLHACVEPDEAAAAGLRAPSYKVAPDGTNLAVISRLLESGDVRVFVDQVFDLDAAADAHRALETGHTRGKIVLKVSDY